MLTRHTRAIAALAALLIAGAVTAPSALAARHKTKHPATHKKATQPAAGLTKAQVLAIVQQYLAAHPPTTPTTDHHHDDGHRGRAHLRGRPGPEAHRQHVLL